MSEPRGTGPAGTAVVSIIIQARMGSTRLPGKVLLDLDGRPLLAHVIERARAIASGSQVIVATTTLERDRPIVRLALESGARPFTGSEDDVLDRYYRAARELGGDIIVRITSDCPLLDPGVSEAVVRAFAVGEYDYASNTRPNSFPDGLDTEVFSFASLERCWHEAKRKSEREYVTQYIWSHPELLRIGNVRAEEDHSSARWTVDTPEDLDFVRRVFEGLRRRRWKGYDYAQVLSVIREDGLQDPSGQFQRNEGLLRTLREEGIAPEEIERLMRIDQAKHMDREGQVKEQDGT